MRLLDWLSNVRSRAALWLCGRIAGPLPETEADRVRKRSTIPLIIASRWRRQRPPRHSPP